MPLQVEDLILIGRELSVAVAERVYRALSQEPLNRYGERIDWLEIRAQIVTRG